MLDSSYKVELENLSGNIISDQRHLINTINISQIIQTSIKCNKEA